MIAPDDAAPRCERDVPAVYGALAVVRGHQGGLAVVRVCACGEVRRSGKSVIGTWHCVHCGRRVE